MTETQVDKLHEEGRTGQARGIIGFLGGLTLGTALGAGLALLFAPSNGEEIRGQLKDTSAQAKDRAGAMAGQVRGQLSTLQGQAQGALGQARERAIAFTGIGEDRAMTLPDMLEGASNKTQQETRTLGDSATAALGDAAAPPSA
jgi:gas vesicle protein